MVTDITNTQQPTTKLGTNMVTEALTPEFAQNARIKHFENNLSEAVKKINDSLVTKNEEPDGSVHVWIDNDKLRPYIMAHYVQKGWIVETLRNMSSWLVFRWPEVKSEGPYR